MCGGEERRRVVLYQRLLIRLGRNPEHDDVAVAIPGLRIDCIRSRIAEEDERLPAYLIDRVVVRAVLHGDMWHAKRQVVHVLDPGRPASVVRHALRVGALLVNSHPDIDVIVFDILGTMVDEPNGIRRGLRTLLQDIDDARTSEFVEVWQRHVGEQQQEVVAGRRPYASSTVIDLEAAARVAAEAEVSDANAVRSLAASAQRLEPWPDSVPALDRIAAHFPVLALSNASHAALTRISAHAGLRWHQVLSAEDARSYKPHPDVYRLAITNAGCPPDRLLMVAAHAWDLRGAQAVGMRTAYVERPVGDPPSAMDSFDLHATGLDDLAIRLTVRQR
jgi:2-haloacid dehalogenase